LPCGDEKAQGAYYEEKKKRGGNKNSSPDLK